jgi:hypothetical protein
MVSDRKSASCSSDMQLPSFFPRAFSLRFGCAPFTMCKQMLLGRARASPKGKIRTHALVEVRRLRVCLCHRRRESAKDIGINRLALLQKWARPATRTQATQ